jgi:hypothetical protein
MLVIVVTEEAEEWRVWLSLSRVGEGSAFEVGGLYKPARSEPGCGALSQPVPMLCTESSWTLDQRGWSSGGCWTTDEGEEILGRSDADSGRGTVRVEILEGIYPIAGPHDQQTTSLCSLLGVASSARIAPLSIGFKGRVYPLS